VPSGPFEPEGVYGDMPYRVLGDGSVEAMMQGGIVRFRSADHLFQALGGGPTIEAAAPNQTVTDLPERPAKVVSSGKVLVVVGLVVGVILYSAKLLDDHSKQLSESSANSAPIAAEATVGNNVADDATALAAASEVNKKWENAFDKTGKYPDRQNADTHNVASIFEVLPAKGTKTIKAYDFGYSPSQAKSLACRSTGYARR
jgi:hypothetical protein